MEYISNQQIISEVNRYLELMGVEKKLITEGSLFDEIVVSAKKLFSRPQVDPRFPSKVFIEGEDITRTLFNKFKKILDRTLDISSLSSSELKQFINILKTSTDVVDNVYNSTIENLMRNNPALNEEKLLKSFQKEIDREIINNPNLKPIDALKNILKRTFNNDELSIGVLIDKFEKKLLDLSKSKLTSQVDLQSTPKVLLNAPNGVKQFQKWMDKNYPDWLAGGKIKKGDFDLKTSTAWNKYKNEFLIPKSLGNKNNVIDFQTWMNRKYPKWYNGGKLPENKKGLYGKKTSSAWLRYQNQYLDDNPIITSLKKSVEKLEDGNLKVYNPSQIDFFRNFATDKTLFNVVRRNLYQLFNNFVVSYDSGLQNVTDEIIGKIDAAYKSKTLDRVEFDTIYREIGIQMNSVTRGGKVDLELMYGFIESALSQTKEFSDDQLRLIMEAIKTKSAFNKQDSWVLKLLKESSWGTWYRTLKNKEIGGWWKLFESIQRIIMFAITGHVRTITEIIKWTTDLGFGKGVAAFIGMLYFCKYIFMPFLMIPYNWISSAIAQYSGDESEKMSGAGEWFWKGITKSFEDNIYDPDGSWKSVKDYVQPFAFPLGKFIDFQDSNARLEIFDEHKQKLKEWGKQKGISEQTMELIIKNLKENKEEAFKQISKLKNTGKSGVAEILNTKLGFISWCATQKPPKTPDPASPWIKEPMEGVPGEFNEFGLTADGKKWAYDPNQNTFIPYG